MSVCMNVWEALLGILPSVKSGLPHCEGANWRENDWRTTGLAHGRGGGMSCPNVQPISEHRGVA